MGRPSTLDFEEFSKIIAELAPRHVGKGDLPKFLSALAEKRQEFSLTIDAGLDSLDNVELVMNFEEKLESLGWGKLELNGDDFEKAGNIGEFYVATCRVLGVTARFPAA